MFNMVYAQVMHQTKVSDRVDFPLEGLDVRPYVIGLRDEPDPVLYDLYGVVNHFGSLNGGHYTATCKNNDSGRWFYHNDSSVSAAGDHQVISEAAYMLFYRRRD